MYRTTALVSLLALVLLVPGAALAVNTGSADFTNYVSAGDSLTAGFMSGSLIDTSQLHDYPLIIATQAGVSDFEQPLVSAAVSEVRKTKMTGKVIFDSFSPALLYLAAQAAPGIPRELDISGLQLLTPAQIEAITGLPVTIINKNISLGLTWADIGQVFRLPGYASPQQFLATGMALQVRIVGGEMDFFGPAEQQQPGSGAAFVAAAHSLGLRTFADPANTPADWNFFASLGVDATYSTIPMGVQLQPAIPEP